MNYYNEIKQKIIDNEIYLKVKDYSKERNTVITYYEIGKLLSEAGSKYGDGVIKEYSTKLSNELGKKYGVRYLFDMKKLYLFSKVHPLGSQLTMSHYRILFTLKEENEINYYIKQVEERNLSKRELRDIIKNEEYKRLPVETRTKNKYKSKVRDLIKKPILINTNYNYNEISEKILKKLIIEDLDNFMKELGNNFSYIGNEYKIKIGDRYNYIDLLLYNIKFKCYIIIELKISELKKEHIGQIQTYMNYIDKNLKTLEEDKTIGIIICKKDNKFIMEYCSDDRILSREYKLISNNF